LITGSFIFFPSPPYLYSNSAVYVMSHNTPPSYDRDDQGTIEMSPLLKSDNSSFDIDLEAQDTPVSIDGIPVEVTFTFTPRWPVEGVEREDVIGRLGKTQQVGPPLKSRHIS
jgi:hypothetical protein